MAIEIRLDYICVDCTMNVYYDGCMFQYYFDASEAEAWMSEQELYMMGEERSKDEIGAQNMMKKHQNLEKAVEDYADVVRQLGERSRNLMETDHPERWDHEQDIKSVSIVYRNNLGSYLLPELCCLFHSA